MLGPGVTTCSPSSILKMLTGSRTSSAAYRVNCSRWGREIICDILSGFCANLNPGAHVYKQFKWLLSPAVWVWESWLWWVSSKWAGCSKWRSNPPCGRCACGTRKTTVRQDIFVHARSPQPAGCEGWLFRWQTWQIPFPSMSHIKHRLHLSKSFLSPHWHSELFKGC